MRTARTYLPLLLSDTLPEEFRFFNGHDFRAFARVSLGLFPGYAFASLVALLLLPCEFLLPFLE